MVYQKEGSPAISPANFATVAGKGAAVALESSLPNAASFIRFAASRRDSAEVVRSKMFSEARTEGGSALIESHS